MTLVELWGRNLKGCTECPLFDMGYAGASRATVVRQGLRLLDVGPVELSKFDKPLLYHSYVEVNESTGVRLFYYFVQSEKDPDVDPLLLWLSGGPGCSSLSGLTHEIDYSCAYIYRTIPIRRKTVSNIIFVDSPVGAGFSYAATQEGSKTSDTKTVKQLVIFLRKVA
ncbi:hypothetical protein OsI_36025 [Oryza sativa Indica Group]|uniref:Uncharacterized protein n=1 Tax=Oryza sativa subsp. indica TaxID=39946 RepID=A2ZE12_ORYSI|nr:hypothetical protein OsI_36025 [Oryza sativa Indica Group]